MSASDNPPEVVDPLLSQLVADRYRIIRKLGEGGMGAVYLAEHVVIEKKFALKVLAAELARRSDLVARFLQEARSASRIGHENVIDIMDFGQAPEGLVYIAMEFLDGKDLGEIVRTKGAMEWAQARGIVLQICRALRAAHDKGIVHRDMKPENIFLIQREGQPHFVKILDFGIAKVMGLDPNGPRLTRTGMIFGTPEYMAPEQAEGKDTDHRADIYAVGCILYHLITGQTPFVAESFMTMLTKHLMEEPVPPSARRPDLTITPEMDALVLKALEKDRDKRWQSMAELLEAVSACAGPETAPAARPSNGQTVEMGGAHAQVAVRVVRPQETARVSPRAIDSALADAEELGERSPAKRGKTIALVAAGIVLGGAVAAWLALSGGSKGPVPVSVPAAVAPVAPAPAPPPPVAPAAPAPAAAAAPEPLPSAVAEEQLELKAKHAGKPSHKAKTAVAKPTSAVSEPSPAPAIPASKTTPPTTPGELKPFPKL